MRVVHVLPSLNFGGAERFIVDLVPQLCKRGADVSLILLTNKNPLTSELPSQLQVWTLRGEGTIYDVPLVCRLAAQVRRLVKLVNADILHSHLYLPDVVTRIALPRGVKHVSTLHAIDEWWLRDDVRARVKTKLDSYTGRWRNTRFVAVSADVAEAGRRALGMPERRLSTISNGIPLARFSRARNYVRRARQRIVQVGRFYPEKNHRLSVQAFELLAPRMPDVTLHFYGDGPMKAEIERSVADRGLNHRVYFHGNVSNVSDELQDADLFWMPSEYEGLSIACAEAMASGLPIIAADVPGLRSMISDGKTGVLVSPQAARQMAEKSEEILSSESLMQNLGVAALEYAFANFDIGRSAKAYMQIYHEVLSHS